MGSQNVLDEILGKVDEMPLENQNLLVELITSKGAASDFLRELEA